ncbi:hypothetical protein [Roseibium alexandrii]|uniref:Uncharacterized protein n=1 Tax=Roseibium alexandrii (strain DSM 17067 / NCIMB 14079 / DFL-11) TaxID=244592 RepID=A0A5E8H1R7_ROSAD|nr:hypothetical protein [Roseibium alexandrii]EEE45802.1 hypothetical protein SADFL11_3091 [Roseibium alexandrii DFL-11]
MNTRDSLVAAIFLAALLGMIVMVLNVPVGIDPKRFGALVFGAILIFGALNLVLVLLEARKNRKDRT